MFKTFAIKEVFDKISEKENHIFKYDEMYTPSKNFQIETEDGYKDVVGMIIKEDEIVHLEIDGGIVKVSNKHRIKLKSGYFEFVYNLSIGDELYNIEGPQKIINIKKFPKETVYDISVNDEKHEYQDADGFVHHNTYGVKQVLTNTLGAYGEGPDAKWAFYEGLKVTAFGLFKLLLLNKKKLIVFDDSDSIWGNADIVNMMKIVTSDSGDRSINWGSNSVANVSLMSREEREAYEYGYLEAVMEDPNTIMKPPSTFNFEGSMINISNLPAEKFDDAIKSRAIFINLYLAQRDVLRRMATIKRMQGRDHETILTLLQALEPDAADALNGKGKYTGEVKYITAEDARKNKKLNMRSLDIAEALMDAGAKDWERMAALYA